MKIKTTLMVFLSCGWLLPLFFGVSSLFSWAQYELTPLLEGRNPGNSFPFIQFAGHMTAISFIWLAAAIAVWVVIRFPGNGEN